MIAGTALTSGKLGLARELLSGVKSGIEVVTAEKSADYTLRIGAAAVEIGKKKIVPAVTYNGQFPGPLLRFKEGQAVVVDVHNDTDTPEQLHWHGQFVSPHIDGAAEEGTPLLRRTGCGGWHLRRSLRACGFITRTIALGLICTRGNTAGR